MKLELEEGLSHICLLVTVYIWLLQNDEPLMGSSYVFILFTLYKVGIEARNDD